MIEDAKKLQPAVKKIDEDVAWKGGPMPKLLERLEGIDYAKVCQKEKINRYWLNTSHW